VTAAEQLWSDLINEDDQGAIDKLADLLAEVRRGRALREAVEGLAEDWDRTAAIFPEYGDLSAAAARSLRDVLAAVDGTP
jgi:hypothetical protein